VRRTPQARLVLALVTVVSTVGFNFHVILPVLAKHTLHAGPETFGILSASFGAGALVGALMAAALGRASWKVLLAGTAGFSLLLLALAPQQSVVACAVLLLATGACFTLWTANSQSILQLSSPDALRGRVLGLYLFAFNGLAPLGSLFSGWLCDVGGTQLALSVAGGAALVMTAAAFRERNRRPVPVRTVVEEEERLAA
jgi:MFS family permease